jgi:hypothetical protein
MAGKRALLRLASALVTAGAIAAAACVGPALAHRMDAAISVLDIRPDGRTLQVTHRLYAHDLEHTLDLGPVGVGWFDTGDGQQALGAYARGAFVLRDGRGRDVPLRFIGAESSGDLVLIYFEGEVPSGRTLEVDSNLLVEFSDRQRNLVNLVRGSQTVSATFGAGDGARQLTIPTAPRRARS